MIQLVLFLISGMQVIKVKISWKSHRKEHFLFYYTGKNFLKSTHFQLNFLNSENFLKTCIPVNIFCKSIVQNVALHLCLTQTNNVIMFFQPHNLFPIICTTRIQCKLTPYKTYLYFSFFFFKLTLYLYINIPLQSSRL